MFGDGMGGVLGGRRSVSRDTRQTQLVGKDDSGDIRGKETGVVIHGIRILSEQSYLSYIHA